MDPIYEDILAKVKAREQQLADARELHLANENQFDSKSQYIVVNAEQNHKQAREVYKEEKIKRNKDISRLSEETETDYESLRDSSLAGQSPLRTTATPPVTSSHLLAESSLQGEGVSVMSDATTCSRTYTGISIQHNKTKKGIKLSINLQTADDAHNNNIVSITAELKRSDRLREIKESQYDTDNFKAFVNSTINEIMDIPRQLRQHIAAGRAHERGQRSVWYQDVFITAELDSYNVVRRVYLNLNGEEYQVEMDKELSTSQATMYHSSGIYGELKLVQMAPTLAGARRTQIK
jgi:hypothetical protein